MRIRLRSVDRQFARFCRTGDPTALGAVFDATAQQLMRVAAWLLGNRPDAEDLLQRTFLTAIENRESFRDRRRVMPWLVGILTNHARNLRRERARRAALPARPEPSGDPAAAAADLEFASMVAEARRTIGEPYAEILDLHLGQGLRAGEIAARLGRPAGTVRTQLVRGLRLLRERLQGGGVAAVVPLALGPATELAIRSSVLAAARDIQGTATVAASSVAAATGGIVMSKKVLLAAPLALLLLGAAAYLAWDQAPAAPSGPPTEASAVRVARETPMRGDEVDGDVQRTAVGENEAEGPVPGAAAEVAVDVLVRAVWKESRQPAGRVPLVLLVQPGDRLARRWTDGAGEARFSVAVPAHQWSRGADRYVSVTTPLMPGRYFNLELAADPGTLEVELADGQRIEGRVVDAAGNPVAGAGVRLVNPLYPEAEVARSDALGTFEVAGLPVGFALRASAGAMESACATIADLDGDGRLVLRLAHAGDLLQVRVVGTRDEPVADASVRLATEWRLEPPPRQLLGSTDAQGFATFAGLPADTYVVEVVHRAHPPAQRRVTTDGLGVPRVETITLGPSATLVGVVRRGSRPASGVQITIGQANSLFYKSGLGTDREGRFTADRLAVGRHEVYFRCDGTDERRMVTLHEGEQTVEFKLPGDAAIAGRLLLPDGSPARGWNVAAQRTDQMGRASFTATGEDGRFACDDLPDEAYCLVVTGPDGGGHRFFDVRADGRAVDYRLPSAALWHPATIVGRIADPPAEATLWTSDAHGGGGNGRTLDPSGRIELGPWAPGRYRLWLEQGGAVLWVTEVELASGQVMDLGVVQLPRRGALVVTLRGTDGVDAKLARVLLRSAAATSGTSFGPRPRLGADGAWHCEGVPIGSWWLVVNGDGIAPVTRELFVSNDSTQRVEIELAPPIPVSVRYTAGEANGTAIGWRRETVRRVGDRAIVLFRNIMGALHTRLDLAPGSYTLEVETGGGFRGTVAFDVPGVLPVEVPLMR